MMTYHNKIPHENMNSKLSVNMAKKFLKIVFGLSNKVIVHSNYAKKYLENIYSDNNKIIYVPHGNYLCNYKPLDKTRSDKIRFAFFGQIKAYKGLERLINSFKKVSNDNIELFLIGKPESDQYKDEIIKLICSDERIKYEFRFIDDKEIPEMFSNIDFLVLPYFSESFLTSGSAILSFSMRTPIIAPNTAMFEDYESSSFVRLFKADFEDSLIEVIREVSLIKIEKIRQIQEEAYISVLNNGWDEYVDILDDDQVM